AKLAEALTRQGDIAAAESASWDAFGSSATNDSDRALARGDRDGAVAAFVASARPSPIQSRKSERGRSERILVQLATPLCQIDVEGIRTLTGLAAAAVADADEARGRALVVFVSSIASTHGELVRALALSRPGDVVAVWMLDNHHRFLWNYEAAREADVAF